MRGGSLKTLNPSASAELGRKMVRMEMFEGVEDRGWTCWSRAREVVENDEKQETSFVLSLSWLVLDINIESANRRL